MRKTKEKMNGFCVMEKFRWVPTAFSIMLLFIFMSIFITTIRIHLDNIEGEDISYNNFFVDIYTETLDLKYWAAKDELCDSINSHIKKVAPRSGLEGLWIIKMTDRYDIDILLCMAQAQNESAYGTTGSARHTNQVFNVGIFDHYKTTSDIPRRKFIDNPNKSIESYCKVIKNDYLGDSRTCMDLLDNFVNLRGDRYASNPVYEQSLFIIYNNLDNKFGDQVAKYNRYKMLTGR